MAWARLLFMMILLLFVIEPRRWRIKRSRNRCCWINAISLESACRRASSYRLHCRMLGESWVFEQSPAQTSNLGAGLNHQRCIRAWILKSLGVRFKYWRLLILLHILNKLESFVHVLSHFLFFDNVEDLLALLVILGGSCLWLSLRLLLKPSSSRTKWP